MRVLVIYLSILIVAIGLLSSCAPTLRSEPTPEATTQHCEINGLVIINKTSGDLDDLRLYVANSNKQVHLNRVLANSEFTTQFPVREYSSNPVNLTWKQNGLPRTSPGIVFSPPAGGYTGAPVIAYLLVYESGAVSAELR